MGQLPHDTWAQLFYKLLRMDHHQMIQASMLNAFGLLWNERKIHIFFLWNWIKFCKIPVKQSSICTNWTWIECFVFAPSFLKTTYKLKYMLWGWRCCLEYYGHQCWWVRDLLLQIAMKVPVARSSLRGGGGELGKLKTYTYGSCYLHKIKLKHAI